LVCASSELRSARAEPWESGGVVVHPTMATALTATAAATNKERTKMGAMEISSVR
jgi:hypothetical protein